MNLEELQSTLHALERMLERHERTAGVLLHHARVGAARSLLRVLAWTYALPIVIGIALVTLGVAVWHRSDVSSWAFACGIAVYVFGLVNIAWASATIARVASLDYAAPVLVIQQRLAALERFEAIGVLVCGLPWWFMWAVVLAAVFSLYGMTFDQGTILWLVASIGVGIAGFAATWLAYAWAKQSGRSALAASLRKIVVGTSLRRALDEIDALRRFESEA